jgi:Tol biopolymer transport system component
MAFQPRTNRKKNDLIGLSLAALVALLVIADASAFALNHKISGMLPEYGQVLSVAMSPDGQRVVYTAILDADGTQGLFSAPTNGSQAPLQLSEPLSAGQFLGSFKISPDSSRVAYLAPNGSGVFELHSVPADGSGLPVRLSELGTAPSGVSTFDITPDSSQMVYSATELYRVPLDGSGPPLKLNAPLVSGGRVRRFNLSPDGSRVLYLANQDNAGTDELYSVLLDRSSPPVKLNGPLVSGGDVHIHRRIEISPDSSRAVYVADQDIDEVDELYVVPVDGSEPPVKLNGPLVSGGDVDAFSDTVISPDSSRALYIADQDNDNLYELFSVALEGGSPPVQISGPLIIGGDVIGYQVSPDGSRVVYLADQQIDGVYELGSAQLDGSAPAVRLNTPLPEGRSVVDYQISPDSRAVVYRADQDSDDIVELYSASLNGIGAPVKLNAPLIPGGNVRRFLFGSNGLGVIYAADQESDEVDELYAVLTDGTLAPVKVNGPLVEDGDVYYWNVEISPDGRYAVYKADQETDGVYELFVTYDGLPAISFSTSLGSATEETGIVTATIRATGTLTVTVQVDYAASGGTASGGGIDYLLDGGTLSFAPGVTSQTVEIQLVDDMLLEPDETVVISLTNPVNGELAIPDSFTLTIVDNDGVPPPPGYTTYLPVVHRE